MIGLGAARDQVLEEVGADGDLAALRRQRADRQALDVARRHLDVEGQAAAHVDAVGAGDAHGQRGQADLVGLELERLALALAGVEGDGALEAGLRLAAGLGLIAARDGVGAGRAFDVVDGQFQPRLVAQREEARRRDRDRHRIAHDHVLRGGADLVAAPGHGREPHRAVEVGQLELDLGRAVGADFDDAGEQCQRRLHRRAALHGHAPAAPSPPERSLPRSARMPSIRRP